MADNPQKIAVIMSLYKSDVLDYVKLATESILNQSYSDFDFYIQYDGYGNQNRVSSPSQMTTKNNISIDAARKTVCDSTLIFPELDNGRNYSSLYDTNKLRDLINNHYSM